MSPPPDEPYTLTRFVTCQRCHGPITLEYRPGLATTLQFWECPHSICSASNVADVLGELIDWWPGHVQKPASREK
jgi:hypothetical protein